jgi:transcription elongation factor S-II
MSIPTSDLQMLKKQITKSISDGKSVVCLEQLEILKGWKATTETLKASRIGVFVTDLRKHSNATEEIKEKSKELIAKWKHDIGRTPEKPQIKTSGSASSLSGKKVCYSKNYSSERSAEPPTPVERNVTLDKVKVSPSSVDGDKVRLKCTEVLYSALATGSDLDSSEILEIAQKVEQAVLAHFKSVSDQYKSKLRSLVSNVYL